MQSIKFSEFSDTAEQEDEAEAAKRGMEIEIQVAGPKEVQCKTIELSLDNRGLIKLRFKEGGKLPAILQGRFTDLPSVKVALTVYQEREAKHFNLAEEVQHPNPDDDQSIDELVDEAAQANPPTFEDKLDSAFDESDGIIEVSLDDDE